MRDDRERLLDILEAIERIGQHAPGDRSSFDASDLVQVWILYHLQIIGEAARALSREVKQQYAEVPWEQISGMRNVLVHVYFAIDRDLVWNTVRNDLPVLKEHVSRMLRALPGEAGADDAP